MRQQLASGLYIFAFYIGCVFIFGKKHSLEYFVICFLRRICKQRLVLFAAVKIRHDLYFYVQRVFFAYSAYFVALDDHQCSYCKRFFPTRRLLRDHSRHHGNLIYFFLYIQAN